jgi:hypothetical protein
MEKSDRAGVRSGTHLTHVFAKLNLTTRTEFAAPLRGQPSTRDAELSTSD